MRTRASRRRFTLLKVITLATLLAAGLLISHARSTAAAASYTPFPIGTPDSTDTSGFALPSANAMAGYTESYATNFTGSTLPAGWNTYSGVPSGDPGAKFSPNAVSVTNNLLTLTASQDASVNPSVAGGNWITGGLCLCGAAGQVNGAYFYRSRVTGAGPSTVGLLWPDSNTWPPEIDFNESSSGGPGCLRPRSTSAPRTR